MSILMAHPKWEKKKSEMTKQEKRAFNNKSRNVVRKRKEKTPEEVKKQKQWHIAAKRAKQRARRREILQEQEELKARLLKELNDGTKPQEA